MVGDVIFKSIVIGCDHAGFEMKEELKNFLGDLFAGISETSLKIIDVGTYSKKPCDYPDFATAAAQKIQSGESDGGILLCGSGIGISIAANRYKVIRCGLCHDADSAENGRIDDDINVLAIAGRTTKLEDAKMMIGKFLTTKFEPGEDNRHLKRLEKFDSLGEKIAN